ncbi:alpha/beta hydrolase [Kitasatospora sp. DSM 101779]|uniref:alpha/beta hydrolase n=1 Tax=Kitasatospora sp. DSM 101779 TaxID=2853165 RepID=UPI0021D7E7B4|nr:lysophospholipase [Kitasatospora sp. DSM 101779]MCU7825853.1 lysophospholipase [Kitasatospora sp. DSM 101779]
MDRSHPERPRIDRFPLEADGEQLAAVALAPADPVGLTAVALHGAGDSDSARLLPLLGDLAARGCRALALDFSGHGASSGRLAELSLERRLRQAAALIDRHAGGGGLVLVGFSMSGQTVADLTARYGPRVRAVGLCAPAVYAREAWPVPFGAGFTGIVRRPGSWRDSAALPALRAFGGRSVLVVPGRDGVIPAEVTAEVGRALTARSEHTRLELPDAVHRLGRWFGEHPSPRQRFVAALLRGAGHPA